MKNTAKIERDNMVNIKVVEIPKGLSSFDISKIGIAIYNLYLEDVKIETILQEIGENSKYKKYIKKKLYLSERQIEWIDFLKKDHNLTLKQIITIALYISRNDEMLHSI
jgi:hypothetical protein